MKDFGDIIYLLLMVVAVVASLIKKNSEKKAPMPPPQKPREVKDLFPDLGKWMEDEEGDAEEIPMAQREPVAVKTPVQPVTVHPNYSAMGDTMSNRTITKAMVVSDDELFDQPVAFDEEPLDLRKAVLYSEIMKRPVW